jgi:hypothetical protein
VGTRHKSVFKLVSNKNGPHAASVRAAQAEGISAGSPQADDPTLLPLHDLPRFEDKLLGTAEVIVLNGCHGPVGNG